MDYNTAENRTTYPNHYEILNEIIDPELGIGLVDLGLIYQIEVDKNGLAVVIMTFTSPACPVGPQLTESVQTKMLMMPDINDCQVEVVWDPPWNQEMIDQNIREMILGL
ncbi:DNA methyltransferase [Candidatus Peregrinibacteria bacterium HGW-Peregrinibacteria-1]|jgi:metal-sulfur cluster biosynthetic enzyme|nr:MAG: DNA methyltransferase [Candidatus Peregrinibacteria bacterium HGW-Peregrinibacteria-1]